jgi:hypothetical protein
MPCHGLGLLVSYDPWVIPHQILPSIAVVIGINWMEVFLLVYIWETLELLMSCASESISEEVSEDHANALISDPVQGLLGIVIGTLMLRVVGRIDMPLFKTRVKAYLFSAAFIIPGVTLVVGGNVIWLYLVVWLCCLSALGYFVSQEEEFPRELFALLVSYATLVAVSVILLKDDFNSFYVGLCAGGVTVVTLLFIDRIKQNKVFPSERIEIVY